MSVPWQSDAAWSGRVVEPPVSEKIGDSRPAVPAGHPTGLEEVIGIGPKGCSRYPQLAGIAPHEGRSGRRRASLIPAAPEHALS